MLNCAYFYLITTTGSGQNTGGSLNYESPEMLVGYLYAEPSTDMWSYGCLLGAWLLRRPLLFEGTTELNQLHNIARVRLVAFYVCLFFMMLCFNVNCLLLYWSNTRCWERLISLTM